MYSYIKGSVETLSEDYAVLEAAGVGYLLYCSRNTADKLTVGEPAKLFVHMAISSTQDSVNLYGFADEAERAMFRSLISVSRIGSKIALAILSHMTAADVAMAVATGNSAAFDPVPGMGKKTADRLLLELKEKVTLPAFTAEATAKAAPRSYDMRADAIEALVALGYDGLTAGKVVGAIGDDEYSTVEQLIKRALTAMPERGRK